LAIPVALQNGRIAMRDRVSGGWDAVKPKDYAPQSASDVHEQYCRPSRSQQRFKMKINVRSTLRTSKKLRAQQIQNICYWQ